MPMSEPNQTETIKKAKEEAGKLIKSWSDEDLDAFVNGTLDPEKEMDMHPTITEGFSVENVKTMAKIELWDRGLMKHPEQKEDEVYMGNFEGNYYETSDGEMEWEETGRGRQTTFEDIQWKTKRKGLMEKDGMCPVFIKRSEWEEMKKNKERI